MTKCNYIISDFKGNLCTYKEYCDFKDKFSGDIHLGEKRIYGICKKYFKEDLE